MAEYILEQSKTQTPCTYHLKDGQPNPHGHRPYQETKLICDTILDSVGNTPLVRLNRIPQEEGVEAEILVKCEFFNPGGSIKDRIALRMVQDAEDSGRITPGVTTIIEPTSGNTGIGLALACAVKGYRLIVTLPDKMSLEKVNALEALGAEVIRTPTLAAFDGPESHLGVAIRLSKEIPNAVILDQYSNPSNPMSHYDQTAEEILRQTGGQVDYLVCAVGTGGHLTGLSRKLKERLPNIHIVAVDVEGSVIALPESLNTIRGGYTVEGIGQMFIPRACLRHTVDTWVKAGNAESFDIARRLVRQEGIFTGGSAGSAVLGAIKFAKSNHVPAGKRMVVMLPDSIRNYLSRFINDPWMIDSGYMLPNPETLAAQDHTVRELNLPQIVAIGPETTLAESLDRMTTMGFNQLPVVDNGKVIGGISVDHINTKLMHKQATTATPVKQFLIPDVKVVAPDYPIQRLFMAFVVRGFVFVKDGETYYIATPVDLAKFLVASSQAS